MAAHRYWKIRPRQFTTYFSVREIELAEVPAGADVTTPATTITLGAFQDGAGSNCVDNNTGTYCQQSPSATAYILVDFGVGNDKDINEVRIMGSPHGGFRSPQDFDIESSDDGVAFATEWAGRYSDADYDAAGAVFITFTRPAVTGAARRWRVLQFDSGDGNMKVAEIILRTAPGGPQVAAGGTPFARQAPAGGYSLAGAFDGNPATGYTHSGGSSGNEYIGYDFGAGNEKDIVEVEIQSMVGFANQAPTDGRIESSTDGIAWAIRAEFSGLVYTSGGSNVIGTGGAADSRRRMSFM